MSATGLLRIILLATIALVLKTALAGEPCAPFEGGRVDPGLIQLMRQAAENGRLDRINTK